MSHLNGFIRFCKVERKFGGPCPQLKALIHLCNGIPEKERIYRLALFVAFGNVATAEVFWRQWPINVFNNCDSQQLLKWLTINWTKLDFRRERDTVRSPYRLTKHLTGLKILFQIDKYRYGFFDDIWNYVTSIPYTGRIAALKLTEGLFRMGFIDERSFDIRPRGADYAREALLIIFRSMMHTPRDRCPSAIAEANDLSNELRAIIHREVDPDFSAFELETALREYLQLTEGTRYPGKALDVDLEFAYDMHVQWMLRYQLHYMRARLEIFPDEFLGEIGGWSGVRHELLSQFKKTGELWGE